MSRIQGWGGSAALDNRRLCTTYAPGVFETTRLVIAAVALLFAAGHLALGMGLMLRAGLPWGLLVQGSAIVPLVLALRSLLAVWDGVLRSGERRILLRRGWVEIGPREVRRLEDASIRTERARFGLGSAFSRLALAFPDGSQVLLLQGPTDEVERFRRVLLGFMPEEQAPSSCR